MEAIGLLVMLEARSGKEADAEANGTRSNSGRESSASSTPLQMRRAGIRT